MWDPTTSAANGWRIQIDRIWRPIGRPKEEWDW
jgi:hypothetical protein